MKTLSEAEVNDIRAGRHLLGRDVTEYLRTYVSLGFLLHGSHVKTDILHPRSEQPPRLCATHLPSAGIYYAIRNSPARRPIDEYGDGLAETRYAISIRAPGFVYVFRRDNFNFDLIIGEYYTYEDVTPYLCVPVKPEDFKLSFRPVDDHVVYANALFWQAIRATPESNL